MKSEPGLRLLTFLSELRVNTTWKVVAIDNGNGASTWQIGGSTWEATVTVDPKRWFVLEFEARDPVTNRAAKYDIDTDLYDISRPQHNDFANAIVNEIIEFLCNLKNGDMLRGHDSSKMVIVFPLDGFYVRVVRGRFVTTTTGHVGLAAAQVGADYETVV